MKADENNETKITELQKRNLLKYQHVWIFSASLHRTKTNKYHIQTAEAYSAGLALANVVL